MSAPKGAHVQDSLVLERRLRPIYDWLDAGNYKKAIQECDKVLKKSPNLDRARALKALSLLRLGKESECVSILDALTATKPAEDSILQAMTMCYRELQQLDRVSKLYEAAVKIDPSNEELHTHLFMSYVRVNDFKAQQQAALQLYKLTPKTPYYCWAVMSVILQATRLPAADDEKKRTLLLSLSERMIDKLIQEHKLEAEQEVQLYMMILHAQGKDEEMLSVLDGPLGAKISGDVAQMRLRILIRLKRWKEANALCKKILSESMDRWDIWKSYIETVLELNHPHYKTRDYDKALAQHEKILDQFPGIYRVDMERIKDGDQRAIIDELSNLCTDSVLKRNGTTTANDAINLNPSTDNPDEDEVIDGETIDNSPDKAHEFICKTMEVCADSQILLRGPCLARFELAKQITDRYGVKQYSLELLGDVMELFVEYFKKFGHKSCCVSDLRCYLYILEASARDLLAAYLLRDVGISATSVPETEQQMQRHICALQLSRLCGKHLSLSSEHINALVTALSFHYLHGNEQFGQDLLSTDQAPADAYILLAAHLLYDLHMMTGSSQPLILALLLLKRTLKHSPSNFHIKLLILKVYHILGCVQGAQALYESLDIKHLQLDSMCFIHAARLATCGNYALAISLFDTTLKFFSTNYKDSSEYLTFSYKYGSFQKLTEFMDFRDRMNNSFHYTSVAVDRMFISLAQCHSIEQVYALDVAVRDDPIDWNAIRNNSDLSVYVSWDPERATGPIEEWPETLAIHAQDLHLLKLRVAVLACLQTTLELCKTNDASQSKTLHARLLAAIEECRRVHDDIVAQQYQPQRQRLLVMPFPSRCESYQLTPFVISAFDMVATLIVAEDFTQCETHVNTAKKEYARLMQEMRAAVDLAAGDDVYVKRRGFYEQLSNVIEVVSVLSMLAMLCLDHVTRSTQTSGGGKKGKRKCGGDGKIKESLQNLVIFLKEDINKLDAALETYMNRTEGERCGAHMLERVSEHLKSLNLSSDADDEEDGVIHVLERSNEICMKEFRSVLRGKLKLLHFAS